MYTELQPMIYKIQKTVHNWQLQLLLRDSHQPTSYLQAENQDLLSSYLDTVNDCHKM